jgi:hypothetical protein
VLSGQGVNIDTTSPAGKMIFSIFGALAEFERELIRERRPPLHKGTKCDIRFKSSLNSARLNLLNPYK